MTSSAADPDMDIEKLAPFLQEKEPGIVQFVQQTKAKITLMRSLSKQCQDEYMELLTTNSGGDPKPIAQTCLAANEAADAVGTSVYPPGKVLALNGSLVDDPDGKWKEPIAMLAKGYKDETEETFNKVAVKILPHSLLPPSLEDKRVKAFMIPN